MMDGLSAIYESGPRAFWYAGCRDRLAWFYSRGSKEDDHDDGHIDLLQCDIRNRRCDFPKTIRQGFQKVHSPPVWVQKNEECILVVAADESLFLFRDDNDQRGRLSFPGYEFSSSCPMATDTCGRITFIVKRLATSSEVVVVLDINAFLTGATECGILIDDYSDVAHGSPARVIRRLSSSPRMAKGCEPSAAKGAISSLISGRTSKSYGDSISDCIAGFDSTNTIHLDLNLDMIPAVGDTAGVFCFELAPKDSVESVDIVSCKSFEQSCDSPAAHSDAARSESPLRQASLCNWRLAIVVRNPSWVDGRLAIFENTKNPDTTHATGKDTIISENLDILGCCLAEIENQDRNPGKENTVHRALQHLHYCKPIVRFVGPHKLALSMSCDDRYGLWTVPVDSRMLQEPKWRSGNSFLVGIGANAAFSLALYAQSFPPKYIHRISNGSSLQKPESTITTRDLEQLQQLQFSSSPNPCSLSSVYPVVKPHLFGEFQVNSFVVHQDAHGFWHAIVSRAGSCPSSKESKDSNCSANFVEDRRFYDEIWTCNLDMGLTIQLPVNSRFSGALIPIFAEHIDGRDVDSSPKNDNSSQARLPVLYLFHSSPRNSGDVYCVCNSIKLDIPHYFAPCQLTYCGATRSTSSQADPLLLSIPHTDSHGYVISPDRIPCVVYVPPTLERDDQVGSGLSPKSATVPQQQKEYYAKKKHRGGKREYPVMVWNHGGPNAHTRYDWHPSCSSYHPERNWHIGSYLASRGYIVVMPNFSGSNRYGLKRFLDGWGFKRSGCNDLEDVCVIGRYLRTRQAQVDIFGERGVEFQSFALRRGVGIGGTSWGGYLTLLALQKQELVASGSYTGSGDTIMPCENGDFQAFPSLFQCGVALCPITDWLMQQKCSSVPQIDHALLGGWVYDRNIRKYAKNISPTYLAEEGGQFPLAPLLLMHGTDDQCVAYAQAENYEARVLSKHKGGCYRVEVESTVKITTESMKTSSLKVFENPCRASGDPCRTGGFYGDSSPSKERSSRRSHEGRIHEGRHSAEMMERPSHRDHYTSQNLSPHVGIAKDVLKEYVDRNDEEPMSFVTYTGENHSLRRYRTTREDILIRLTNFFSQHLLGWS